VSFNCIDPQVSLLYPPKQTAKATKDKQRQLFFPRDEDRLPMSPTFSVNKDPMIAPLILVPY
jgi:hypothetical protein